MSKPNFPVPYPGQSANDDLGATRLLLGAVAFGMEDGDTLSSLEVQCLFNVLCAATEKLEIIQLFLDDLECPNAAEQYLAARRLWVMQKGGAK